MDSKIVIYATTALAAGLFIGLITIRGICFCINDAVKHGYNIDISQKGLKISPVEQEDSQCAH